MPAAFYAKQKLVILDSTYTMIAESLDKGVVRISAWEPHRYLWKEGVKQRKAFSGLFLFEKGILTICYNLKGDSYPDNMETRGKPLYFCRYSPASPALNSNIQSCRQIRSACFTENIQLIIMYKPASMTMVSRAVIYAYASWCCLACRF